MARAQELAAFEYARKSSPMFVEVGYGDNVDSIIGFFGEMNSAAVNRVLSFQGTLYREFRLFSKISSIHDGCFEIGFSLGGRGASAQLLTLAKNGNLDPLAYRHRILFIRAYGAGGEEEVHFHRDSLYR
ncbi:hypothetical protein [Loktanella sp. M215]|uniref:hypothetical protein n=1 Tax=Loktanella sp. M215 TaxID=2675431 RepID=UPI001F3C3828|nr:hypothetical protein [Loktanella sp. M215]MCF7698764.1 hypothetical protein [Loktanella sp. M215]